MLGFLFNQTGWCLDHSWLTMTGSCAWIARGVNRNGHGGSFLFVPTFSVTLTVKLILKGGEGDLSEVGKINKVILCFNKPINSSSSIPGSKLWYARCAHMFRWCLPQLNSFTKNTDVAQPHWCDNLPPCKSELFLNSCPQRKHGEEFFTPNLCISYIPTHQLRTLPHILPQIHTLSKINTFLPPLTFPYCPGWSLDAQKKLFNYFLASIHCNGRFVYFLGVI